MTFYQALEKLIEKPYMYTGNSIHTPYYRANTWNITLTTEKDIEEPYA